MKTRNILRVWLMGILLLLGTGIIYAQSSRNLGLTGGPDLGVYPGYEEDGIFHLTFNNVAGSNPPNNTPLPGGSLQIVMALPVGIEFAEETAYVPPVGWSYSRPTPTSAVLTQIGPVSQSPPASIVGFDVPIVTKAPVTNGVWSAQIQRILPTYIDPDPNNNTPNGEVSVLDVNLPVTLVAFHASKEGAAAHLSWSTSEETNSDFFEVQHSTNMKNWTVIGKVKSAGESSVLQQYFYQHEKPAGGQNYYRLRMVDGDETFTYSATRSIKFEGGDDFQIYPNPASEKLVLSNAEQISKVSVYDMSGRKRINAEGKSSNEVNLSSLPDGRYIVEIVDRNGVPHTKSLVVVH